jgi:prevent-host-death family protein
MPTARSHSLDGLSDNWQAAEARQRFSDVIDAAVDGRPQFVQRRDGKEVVVVSRAYFERTRPDLKTVLLSCQFGHDGDAFDQLLAEGREVVSALFVPNFEEGFDGADNNGHEHPERSAEAEAASGADRLAGGSRPR